MRINTPAFGNYNPSTIINNPPYITNHPFYEYMRDNKLDFDSTDLRMFKTMVKNSQDNDNYMTGLLCATLTGVGIAGYVGRNKLINGWQRLCSETRRLFHR